MKNKSLTAIISAGIFLFLGLVFAVYQIALKNDNEFYADGYVSVTNVDLSNKVYFTAGTVYKKGYNNEIVFKNSENERAEVSKYSFVYYKNKSIGYLNDGVLMALDELDTDYIPYYNIKNNYIISYESGRYNIKTKTKNILLDNFIGRIDENKYVVAGNSLKLKLASSDELVSNYYFEINFVEGNQIKIDNDSINIKTVGEESYIYVGNDVIIDLNNRIIKYKGNFKLNLSEITINSDENIDLLYDDSQNNEINDGNGGNGNGGNGQGGNGNGQGGNDNYQPERVVEYKNIPYVELLSSNISSNRIRLEYRVIDSFKLITSNITVRYMNLKTSEVEEVYCTDYELCVFDAQNLSSNTKYLVTILTDYTRSGVLHNDFIMFQRTFQTSELSLSLEKEYVTSDGIAYRIKMNNDSNFDGATLNLYNNNGELVNSIEFSNNHQDIILSFDGLDSNSSYTAKIEDLVINNVTFKTSDFGTSINKTLKYNPLKDSFIINNPKASSNKKDHTFSFDLGTTDDKDNAIKEVVYTIYETESQEVVKTIKKENTLPFTFEAGEEFENDKKYVYQATLRINDNEKIVYQKTLLSNEFSLTTKVSPYATFTKGESTANTLAGSFKIYDTDNTVDITKGVYIEYYDSDGVKATPYALSYKECDANESATTKCVDLYLDGLTSNSTYTISLFAYVDLKDDPNNENYIEPGYTQVSIVQIKTTVADIIYTLWNLKELPMSELQNKVFELNLQFYIDENITSPLVVNNMESFDMLLYEGSEENEVLLKTIHVKSNNIKEEYFDNPKTISLDTFGYTLNDLINRHLVDGSKISQRYTIRLTNGKSGTDYVDFRKASFVFDIDPALLEITTDTATINVNLIKNKSAEDDYKDPNAYSDTYVAMEIIPYFDNKPYVSSINYVLYDVTDNNKQYSFKHNNLELTEESDIPVEILKIYNTDSEEFLKRGHSYIVTYTLSLDLNGDGIADLEYPISTDITTPDPVTSSKIDVPKQKPSFMMLPWTSTSDSITYKYDIEDVDHVLNPNADVIYYVNDVKHFGDKENAYCLKSPNISVDYNYEFNCVLLNNLNDKDIYTIYFEGKLLEGYNAPTVQFKVSDFEFESIMSESEINSKISFEASTKYNNLVLLKIKDTTNDSKYIKKIANYKLIVRTLDGSKKFIIDNVNDGNSYSNGSALSFSSNNKITYISGNTNISPNVNNEPNLGSVAYVDYCEGDGGDQCIFLDYAKLYNSTSLGTYFQPLKGEDLIVEVGFTYDTGKVGYYATTAKQYAFQVKTTEDLVIKGQQINDYYYITTTNYMINGSNYNFGALSGVYSYIPISGGFAADSDGGGSGEESNTRGRKGEINFTNGIFNGQSFNLNYYLGAKGVIVNINGFEHPILAKELASTTSINTVGFKYEKVSPAIGAAISAPTINGIRLRLQTYGYAVDDVDFEDGKQYLYLEVYNNSNSVIQTLKINKDELISQSGTITNKKFTLNSTSGSGFANYKYNITRVEVNGVNTTQYSYDYINGVITLNDTITAGNNSFEVTDGMSIYVTYNIAVYGLDIDTEYYYMAYMKMGGTKTYLIDSTSKTYENAHKEFRTLAINSNAVKLNDVRFGVTSLDDYLTRYLTTSFAIGNDKGSEVIGFEDFIYEISYNGKKLNISSTNACKSQMSGNFATLSNSCLLNNLYYSVYTYLDISNGHVTDDEGLFKFIFGTNYDLVIKAKILTTNGYDYEVVYSGGQSVRKLEEPTVDVTKRSLYLDEKNALRFVVSFNDPDRVLSGFDYLETGGGISVENGNYLAYLAKNTKRVRDSELTTYKVEGAGLNSIVYTKGTLPEDINGLQYDTDYYLILKYAVSTNNIDAEELKSTELRFPIYTLDESRVALGKVAYFASNENGKGVSELTFSYATNIMEDPEIVDQEAYVAGMLYDISIFGGDMISSGRVFFVDINDPNEDLVNINYVKNTNASSELGENYYQIFLTHNEYPQGSGGATYELNFQLYLGGNIAKDLNTENKCRYTDGVENSNYWDSHNNKCYILSSLAHHYSAQFKGSTGGEQ